MKVGEVVAVASVALAIGFFSGIGVQRQEDLGEIRAAQRKSREVTLFSDLEAGFYKQQKSCDEAMDAAQEIYGDCVAMCRGGKEVERGERL